MNENGPGNKHRLKVLIDENRDNIKTRRRGLSKVMKQIPMKFATSSLLFNSSGVCQLNSLPREKCSSVEITVRLLSFVKKSCLYTDSQLSRNVSPVFRQHAMGESPPNTEVTLGMMRHK